MFQRPPPGFNQRVGARDLGLSQDSANGTTLDEFVDVRVYVLDSLISEQRRRFAGLCCVMRGFDEDGDGIAGVEPLRNAPRQNSPREIVDNGVEVRSRSGTLACRRGVELRSCRCAKPCLVGRLGCRASASVDGLVSAVDAIASCPKYRT